MIRLGLVLLGCAAVVAAPFWIYWLVTDVPG